MSEFDVGGVEHCVRMMLRAAGQDVDREGLQQTPARYARFLESWVNPKPFKFTTFDAEGADEMIVQTGCQFFSLCEHHMLPFYGTAVVGYLPDKRIVGLSKLARAVRYCAAGFQNQERITNAVADMIEREVQPRGIGVVLRAEHLCMSLRGVQAPGTVTQTSSVRGLFREDAMVRAEFMDLALGRER
jgi:GTP cyclohydrolase I